MAHTTECSCGTDWVFRVWVTETADITLNTMRLDQIIHPISAEWQNILNEPGTATITIDIHPESLEDPLTGQPRRWVWPNSSLISIERISGDDGASPASPIIEFVGYIEQFSADARGGTASLGLRTVDALLEKVIIADPDNDTFDQVDQNEILETLCTKYVIEYGWNTSGDYGPDGIPPEYGGFWLTFDSVNGARDRDRTYYGDDLASLYERVKQMTEVINGGDYEFQYQVIDNHLYVTMVFRDRVGKTASQQTYVNDDLLDFSIDVDGTDQVLQVLGVSARDAAGIRYAYADRDLGYYPILHTQAGIAYEEIRAGVADPLGWVQEKVEGELEDRKNAFANPSFSVPGLTKMKPRMGDTITLNACHGLCSYNGEGRIVAISGSLQRGSPYTRTFELDGLASAIDAVFDYCEVDCEGMAVWENPQ